MMLYFAVIILTPSPTRGEGAVVCRFNLNSSRLWIPGSRLRGALSDKRYALTRGMTVMVADTN
jgi:hypothetical protein